jgi:hypothetical protein
VCRIRAIPDDASSVAMIRSMRTMARPPHATPGCVTAVAQLIPRIS